MNEEKKSKYNQFLTVFSFRKPKKTLKKTTFSSCEAAAPQSGYNSIWSQRTEKEDRSLERRGRHEKNEALHLVKEINWSRDMPTLIFTMGTCLHSCAHVCSIVFILYTILSGKIAVFEGLAGNKRGFILFCAGDNSSELFRHFFILI